jgi:hypothetical protein
MVRLSRSQSDIAPKRAEPAGFDLPNCNFKTTTILGSLIVTSSPLAFPEKLLYLDK